MIHNFLNDLNVIFGWSSPLNTERLLGILKSRLQTSLRTEAVPDHSVPCRGSIFRDQNAEYALFVYSVKPSATVSDTIKKCLRVHKIFLGSSERKIQFMLHGKLSFLNNFIIFPLFFQKPFVTNSHKFCNGQRTAKIRPLLLKWTADLSQH